MNEKMKQYPFDIIVIAGQSNAEGNALLTPGKSYHCDDVFQMTDDSLTVYGYGKLDYTTPAGFPIGYASFRKCNYVCTEDLSETFADEYIRCGFLEKGRKLLIVKAAVGGTGFSLSQWGVGNPLHTRLKDMIDYALSLGSENRLVAFLWHQGEHDAFEQAELSAGEREKFYYDAFRKTVEDLRATYRQSDLPVIAGEMVDDWANKNKEATSAVERATKEACADLGHAAVASSAGLLSNAQTIERCVDDIHFCADAIEELGRRYFALWRQITGRM